MDVAYAVCENVYTAAVNEAFSHLSSSQLFLSGFK